MTVHWFCVIVRPRSDELSLGPLGTPFRPHMGSQGPFEGGLGLRMLQIVDVLEAKSLKSFPKLCLRRSRLSMFRRTILKIVP